MSEAKVDIPRRECDTRNSYPALCDYCRMGPGRSLRKLHEHYLNQASTESQPDPPTKYLSTIKTWSAKYDWAERAAAYDEKIEVWKEEKAKETLQEGLSQVHHRVIELKDLYRQLKGELEDGALWLEDVKSIGSGEHGTFEVVEIRRFNAALVKQLRGVLDDIAAETGGRKQRMDITSGDDPITDINLHLHPPRDGRLTEEEDG